MHIYTAYVYVSFPYTTDVIINLPEFDTIWCIAHFTSSFNENEKLLVQKSLLLLSKERERASAKNLNSENSITYLINHLKSLSCPILQRYCIYLKINLNSVNFFSVYFRCDHFLFVRSISFYSHSICPTIFLLFEIILYDKWKERVEKGKDSHGKQFIFNKKTQTKFC